MTAPDELHDRLAADSSRGIVTLRIGGFDDDRGDKKKSRGFHLTRSEWDPYPWVGSVETGSIADKAGLRAGDCLLDVSGKDIVGLRVKEIADLIRNDSRERVSIQVWRRTEYPDHDQESAGVGEGRGAGGVALEGPLPEVARKLASAVSGVVKALECPVCLESAAPPVSQCVHGHLLCVGCRPKTDRCPVCRVRLGQGRCLLADNVHRILYEAFDISENENKLGDRLFGKRCKNKTGYREPGKSGGRHAVRPRQLLARLLLGGGVERAASAENLPAIVQEDNGCGGSDGRRLVSRRLGELSMSDRAKSASTGELSNDYEIPNRDFYNNSNPDVSSVSRTCLLSVPQTPTWGGSTDSISGLLLRCPVSNSTGCNERVTPGFVLEHLSRTHEGPQVHFHQGAATIPLPLPFGPNAAYIFHHRGELFFFKCEDEGAWMLSTGGGNTWAWILRGWGVNGTELKLRRKVATLEDTASVKPLPDQVAPVPKALGIQTVEVKLIETSVDEGLAM